MDEANQCLDCKKPQLPERCLSRKAGIVQCCLKDRG